MVAPLKSLILASASPRRSHLLSGVGLHFDVQPADVEEIPEAGEDACGFALRVSRAKALATAAEAKGDSCILGVDTVVVVDGEILGKPDDAEHGLAMLQRLRGRGHDVITAWCLRKSDGSERQGSVSTRVELVDAPDDVLRAYIATGEPADKAGAYGIQGIGGFLVKHIEGSYSNVVGLPLAEVLADLEDFAGIRPWQLT